jgi:hypothetical protein
MGTGVKKEGTPIVRATKDVNKWLVSLFFSVFGRASWNGGRQRTFLLIEMSPAAISTMDDDSLVYYIRM